MGRLVWLARLISSSALASPTTTILCRVNTPSRRLCHCQFLRSITSERYQRRTVNWTSPLLVWRTITSIRTSPGLSQIPIFLARFFLEAIRRSSQQNPKTITTLAYETHLPYTVPFQNQVHPTWVLSHSVRGLRRTLKCALP